MTTLLFQGAEARVFVDGGPAPQFVLKQRLVKQYRPEALDTKLNRARVKGEARGLLKAARAGVRVPRVDLVDETRLLLVMEFVPGPSLKQVFDATREEDQPVKVVAARLLGEAVAKLHSAGMAHGDLTTSNAILEPVGVGGVGGGGGGGGGHRIALIDFGLATNTKSNEDFGVDLYVLERAFLSTHPRSEALFQAVLDAYVQARGSPGPGDATRRVFEEVRARGRKRTAFG